MHRTNWLTMSIVSLGLLGGCTWSPDANINGGGAGGFGGHNNVGLGGQIGVSVDGSVGPTTDANCGVTNHMGNRLPPDLLLVFDRSGSMAADPTTNMNCTPAATCPSKWNQATAAVSTAVTASQGTIEWGLKLFSNAQGNNNTCTVNAGAQVPIALNNGMAITTALAGTGPAGSTPTTAAVTRGGDYLMTLTTQNPRFIVLVTDGLPTCANGNGNGSDAPAAIAAVTAQAARGFGTFVIGVATVGDNTADSTLTSMSTAGMHPRTGTPNYYVVNNTAELVTALESIGTQVSSCTFTLDSVPPDPTNIKVLADTKTVPANDVNGWVYEAGMRAVTLKGTYCDDVLSHTTMNVSVLFGCPGVMIP